MTELCDLDAVELRRLIGAKRISPVELLDSCLARIEAVNPALNAVVAMDVEGAREAAEAAETMVRAGDVKTFKNFIVNLPPGFDPSAFNTVIVWCESFGEFITAARYR